MPTYSVGTSYLLYSGYPKTSIDEGIKRCACASFFTEVLRIFAFTVLFPFCLERNRILYNLITLYREIEKLVGLLL